MTITDEGNVFIFLYPFYCMVIGDYTPNLTSWLYHVNLADINQISSQKIAA